MMVRAEEIYIYIIHCLVLTPGNNKIMNFSLQIKSIEESVQHLYSNFMKFTGGLSAFYWTSVLTLTNLRNNMKASINENCYNFNTFCQLHFIFVTHINILFTLDGVLNTVYKLKY